MLHRNATGSMLVAGAERWSHYLPHRFKRKWGAAVGLHAENVHALLVRWNAANPVVLRFLAESPLIFHDGHGLSAIHADRITPRRSLLAPGLRRLFTPLPGAAFGAWEEDCGEGSADDDRC